MYQPSVETGCSPYSSTTSEINRSIATNIFCSFDILIPSISLLSGSIEQPANPDEF